MALPSTMHVFRLDISDIDRHVYEAVEVRVARHPSETLRYLVTRVIAFALEYQDGLAFGRGVSTADEPAIHYTDPTGRITVWIDVGAPSPERVHKASKTGASVAIYTAKGLELLGRRLGEASIYRAESVRVVGLSAEMVERLGEAVGRRNDWGIVHTDGALYVTIGDGRSWEGTVTRRTVA